MKISTMMITKVVAMTINYSPRVLVAHYLSYSSYLSSEQSYS